MHKLSIIELNKYIQEIVECDAFELHSHETSFTDSEDSSANYYIPYMMNDALECYILLKKGRMTGKYIPDLKEKITAELCPQQENSALIFRQGTENVFTIWFENAYRVLNCYRYDQIGHFWVKNHEHWRRLVYIIGTIYDKYEYMGKQVCTEQEIDLLPLMEFAPFRMYSPIHESLDAYYEESKKGLASMKSFAKEAGDKAFLPLLALYGVFPCSFMRNLLYRAMNHPDRQKLYELLFYKVQEASSVYPERSYHPALNAEISSARNNITAQLHQLGYTGTYPKFQKKNIQILAMEEHPFTILEAKDFSFRVQFMVSESKQHAASLNAGFFKKRGNHCRIASDIHDI